MAPRMMSWVGALLIISSPVVLLGGAMLRSRAVLWAGPAMFAIGMTLVCFAIRAAVRARREVESRFDAMLRAEAERKREQPRP